MADKRISQLTDRGTVANSDVVPIVVSGAVTTNKATISSIQTFMQGNLDLGVTSVGITLGSSGTDVSVSGSPVTSSGNITINIPTASATNRGALSSADWSTFNSKVSSVGLSMPSAFTVSNSPITGSGTIAVTGSGTVSQYIRGDGSLADFPQGGGGGGASVSYYLNGSVSQGTIGGIAYREMNKTPIFGAGTDFVAIADGYLASFITDAGDPALLEIPAGNWNFETYFSASSAGGTPSFYIELYKVNSGGTATLIASNSATPELIAFGTSITPYFSALAVPTTTLDLTDRLALRYYVARSGRTITMHTENSHLCQIITTFTTGLTALNGLTAQVQNFATGTTGTDFGISSSTSTHTFNLPDASATARGVVTTGTQTFEGAKTFNSSVTASSLIRTGGTSSQFLKADGSVDSSTYYLASNPSGFTTNLGTVTSVAALTLGTSGNDLSSTVANGTTTPVITLNVPDASASARGVVTTGAQTIAGAKTLTSPLNGTTSIFSSSFATNETSKIGIGFESGYGLINAWGSDASTYAGLKFQVSESDGNTYDALRINTDGTLYAPAGGYISILEAASLRVNYAQGFSQELTAPVAKFLNSANNFVKIALGQGETSPNFNDYYGIIALDNNVNLADNKLRFYLGYDDAANSHSNDQLVIQGDGNVGIGTATPSAKLHVMGTATLTGALSGTSATWSNINVFTGASVGTGSQRWIGSDGGAGLFLNTPTGSGINLAINNNPVLGIASTGAATFSSNALSLQGSSFPAITAKATATFPIFSLVNDAQSAQWNIELGRTVSGNLEFYNSGTKISFTPAGAATFSSSVTTLGSVDITGTGDVLTLRKASNVPALTFIGATSNTIIEGGNTFNLYTGGTGSRIFVTATGNVGIGTASPNTKLQVEDGFISTYHNINANGAGYGIQFYTNGGGSKNTIADIGISQDGTARSGDMIFSTSNAGAPTGRMRITSGGSVGIGPSGTASSISRLIAAGAGTSSAAYAFIATNSSGGGLFEVRNDGAVNVPGSLSKGSGSFRIDHPLQSKKDTHHLVHSFIEGPQADNIYRGKIELTNGYAEVNIDEASGMTEETFLVLNGNIQCFTSNESGWTAIRGKVEGNILKIEAQDSKCLDTISWLVIGERIDQHMIDTDWTDENGKVIVEPLKEKKKESEILNEDLQNQNQTQDESNS